MNIAAVVGMVCLIAWAVLVFAFAVPSGWVHVPLGIGCVLMARAIVLGRRPT